MVAQQANEIEDLKKENQSLKAELAKTQKAKAQLETAVSTQKETIAAQTAAAEKQNTAMLALQQSRDESEAGRRTLEDLLQKHDLAAIARKNSSALEIRINRATDKVFTDIEQLTSPTDRPPLVVTKPVAK